MILAAWPPCLVLVLLLLLLASSNYSTVVPGFHDQMLLIYLYTGMHDEEAILDEPSGYSRVYSLRLTRADR